jgi:hypothetical protein
MDFDTDLWLLLWARQTVQFLPKGLFEAPQSVENDKSKARSNAPPVKLLHAKNGRQQKVLKI